MLPYSSRIKRADFVLLKDFRKNVFSSKNFTLKLYRSGFNPSRFAVIIPLSVSKKAAKRNRLKRKTKGMILEYLNKFKHGFAALVYFKKTSADISIGEIKKELTGLFKKSRVLK